MCRSIPEACEIAGSANGKRRAERSGTMKRLLIASLFAVSCAGDQGPMAPGTGRVESSLTGTVSGGSVVHAPMMGGGSGAPNKPLGVTQIIVTVAKVTAHSNSAGWVTLSSTETTVDILKLADYAQPLGFANMPAGKITQVRLYVKDGGTQYVIRDDGTKVDLKVPSGIQSGIKLKGMFDVAGCNLTSVPMQWDGKHSIWVHPTGQGDEWILRPVIRLGDITASNVGCMPGGPNPGDNPDGNPDGNPTGEPPVMDPGQPGTGGGGTLNEDPGSGMPGTGPTTGTLPTGAACTGDSMCLSGVCTGGSCDLGGAGVPCSAATDCRSGTCGADNVCGVGTAVGAGFPCATNSDCLSNSCSAGVCVEGGQGQPCMAAADCAQGFSCTAGVCEPMIN
jgi:hypothetical protein